MDIELTQQVETEAIDSVPFEALLTGLMENRPEFESVYLLMKQEDPNSLAIELANFVTKRSNEGGDLVIYINIFRKLFADTLKDSFIVLDVKIVALKAMVDFIKCLGSSSKDKERFQNLLPIMMKILTEALMEKELEGTAQSELEILIDLAKNEPRFFRTELVDVINSMFEIVESESFEKETRHLAVEFMMTLAEAKVKAPGMVKKYPLFAYKFFAVLLKLLEEVDPADDAWDSVDHLFGKKCLIRLSIAVGGKTIVPVALEQLELAYSADEDSWQKLYAALNGLGLIAEGCSEAMIKYMKQVVIMVLNCMGYPHPRVRSAALGVIEFFSCVLAPHFQEQCHDQLLPALTKAMDDDNARVQNSAMRAAGRFSEFCMGEHLISHVDELFGKLRELLSLGLKHKGYTEIQEHGIQDSAVFLLGVTAAKFKGRFLHYFKSFRPYYKTVAARAVEMMILDSALGEEEFSDDIEQVLHHNNNNNNNMPSVISYGGAWKE